MPRHLWPVYYRFTHAKPNLDAHNFNPHYLSHDRYPYQDAHPKNRSPNAVAFRCPNKLTNISPINPST